MHTVRVKAFKREVSKLEIWAQSRVFSVQKPREVQEVPGGGDSGDVVPSA